MSGVRIEKQGALAVLRLDKARGNAIDEPLADDLVRGAAEIGADSAVRGVLLASAHPKLFCPGLDLVALYEYDRAGMERFITKFGAAMLGLFALRKPVVAAVAGHAVAGGCVLALTTDHRMLRRGIADRAQRGPGRNPPALVGRDPAQERGGAGRAVARGPSRAELQGRRGGGLGPRPRGGRRPRASRPPASPACRSSRTGTRPRSAPRRPTCGMRCCARCAPRKPRGRESSWTPGSRRWRARRSRKPWTRSPRRAEPGDQALRVRRQRKTRARPAKTAATRASARFASARRLFTASQFSASDEPAITRKAYQIAEARAAGPMAFQGRRPTTPAKGVTPARMPGRKRLRKMPSDAVAVVGVLQGVHDRGRHDLAPPPFAKEGRAVGAREVVGPGRRAHVGEPAQDAEQDHRHLAALREEGAREPRPRRRAREGRRSRPRRAPSGPGRSEPPAAGTASRGSGQPRGRIASWTRCTIER